MTGVHRVGSIQATCIFTPVPDSAALRRTGHGQR